jgi:hypothetical protein
VSTPRIIATSSEIAHWFDVMRLLRPQLASAESFIAAVEKQQAEGYRLAALEHEGRVVTVAGYRGATYPRDR